MHRLFFLAGIAWLSMSQAVAQHQDPSWSVRRATINKQCVEGDSLCNVLHNLGTFEGHLRTYYMGTTNRGSFPDYHALGMGGGLGYYSPVIKNFQVGMSGFMIFNVASSHLGPQAPYNNRYEVGLFDITNPDNHEDLDRLEDLYVRYYLSTETKSYVQYGKFHLKTPLINLQDGRMRPNLQEGFWGEYNNLERLKFKAGWLTHTSPRSTIGWYDIGSSVGIYPSGRATNGEKADYAGHVTTPGIAIAQVSAELSSKLSLQVWNYMVPQLFNIASPRVEWTTNLKGNEWKAGMMYLWQRSLDSGDLPVEQQYISPNEQSHSFSGSVSKTNLKTSTKWALNYTRITTHGRFLFPREWGIEPFYTFMFRERTEGAGDVHAAMAQNQIFIDKSRHFSLLSAAGVYWMPSVDSAALNKYALPGFYQLYTRGRYKFTGFLHGLNVDLLYTYKGALDQQLQEIPANFHNKVDMHHLSLVFDYYF